MPDLTTRVPESLGGGGDTRYNIDNVFIVLLKRNKELLDFLDVIKSSNKKQETAKDLLTQFHDGTKELTDYIQIPEQRTAMGRMFRENREGMEKYSNYVSFLNNFTLSQTIVVDNRFLTRLNQAEKVYKSMITDRPYRGGRINVIDLRNQADIMNLDDIAEEASYQFGQIKRGFKRVEALKKTDVKSIQFRLYQNKELYNY